MLVDPESKRVLGVGIVGAGAGEMIAEAVSGDRDGSGGSRRVGEHPPAPDTE